MSEVDRLSNSGLYPALPIGDQRRPRDQNSGSAPDDKSKPKAPPAAKEESAGSESGVYRVPKSLIDDYA